MNNRFGGKVAVVTGGASGIGAEISRRIVADGGGVLIADLDEEKGRALVDELGSGMAVFQRTDVSRLAEVEAMAAQADARFGGIDLLFNNAGMGAIPSDATQLPPEAWAQVIAVNLNSVYYGCRAVIPYMRRRGQGAIVNTASISGLAADYGFGPYNASKAAVINYTRTLALDHAQDRIRVNALCPGYILTPLTAATQMMGLHEPWIANIPMKRGGQATEISNVATFLASDEASFVTGAVFVADGGASSYTGQPNLLSMMQAASA